MNSQHYPSLELCKKLPKDICNSWFWYAECQWLWVQHDPVFISKEEFYSTTKSKWNEWIDLNWIFIECPSIAEMLDFMPKEIPFSVNIHGVDIPVWRNLVIGKNTTEWWFYCKYVYGTMHGKLSDNQIIYDMNTEIHKNWTLPNALAEMILWLHDNKYLTFSTHD